MLFFVGDRFNGHTHYMQQHNKKCEPLWTALWFWCFEAKQTSPVPNIQGASCPSSVHLDIVLAVWIMRSQQLQGERCHPPALKTSSLSKKQAANWTLHLESQDIAWLLLFKILVFGKMRIKTEATDFYFLHCQTILLFHFLVARVFPWKIRRGYWARQFQSLDQRFSTTCTRPSYGPSFFSDWYSRLLLQTLTTSFCARPLWNSVVCLPLSHKGLLAATNFSLMMV